MGKVAQSRKKAPQTPKQNKKEKSKIVDLNKETDGEEEDEIEEKESENKENHSKSNFLNECKQLFGTTDLYSVLHLSKSATQNDIKKSYYKLSLKYHPDKCEESKKEDSKNKFQVLGKIYSILSDDEKRKCYDDTGSIDGEDEFFNSDIKDWQSYWRCLFKKITTEDVDKFFEKYQNSEEERKDLLKFYEKHKGDMDLILEEMFTSDCLVDESRFKDIISEAIDKGEVAKYEKFVNESKKKATKRKANFEKEAKEAEELRKEMGIDESQESLKKAILSRRKKETDSFLERLTEKYSKPNKKSAKNAKVAKKEESENEEDEKEEEEDEEEEEEEEEEETEEEKSEEEQEEDEEVEEDNKKKNTRAKRSSVAKKPTASVKPGTKGKKIQKKVKRL